MKEIHQQKVRTIRAMYDTVLEEYEVNVFLCAVNLFVQVVFYADKENRVLQDGSQSFWLTQKLKLYSSLSYLTLNFVLQPRKPQVLI